MEITFKFIIDGVHPKKNFTLPVRLRLYQGRNYRELSLGFSVLKDHWDEQLQQVLSSNPDHLTYNTKISSFRSKIQKFLLLNEDRDSLITPKELIDHLPRKESRNQVTKPDIFLYGRQHIAKLQATGNIGNAIAYSCAINKLRGFAKVECLLFEAISYKYLESFNNSMLAEGIKVNSISLYLRTIRALFNKAIKDGSLEAKCYPFSTFKIKSEKTISRALTKLEMAKIASLKLTSHTPIWHQRNLFLLSFCFIGINLADLLTLTRESLVAN
jgi:integrase/recombinase XerD